MSVEILIYTYLAICAGMIVFNIVTVVLSRHKRLRSFSASIRLELRIAVCPPVARSVRRICGT